MMLKGFLFSYTVEKVNSGQNSLNGNLGSEKTRILAYFAQCICDLELPKQWRTSGIFLKMISKKKTWANICFLQTPTLLNGFYDWHNFVGVHFTR